MTDKKHVRLLDLLFLLWLQLGQAETGAGFAEPEGTIGTGKRSRDCSGSLLIRALDRVLASWIYTA